MTVLRSGSATDIGRVRSSNQDISLEEPNLFAVADGMGGHAGGEVAAEVAVAALRSAFTRQATVVGLRQAVAEANAAVWRQSQLQAELRGMGTTLTAMALVSGADGRDVVALANVGDSRAYVLSAGALTQVTADHSLAEEKVRQGELTEAEAAVHPHRHILTRALGVAAGVDVDLWELHLRTGDRVLLCSDGLTNEVGADQIAQVLGSVPDPGVAAHKLVEAANAHGGSDNITVVIVDVLVGEQEVPGARASGAGAAAGAAGAVLGADQAAAAAPAAPATAPAPGGASPMAREGDVPTTDRAPGAGGATAAAYSAAGTGALTGVVPAAADGGPAATAAAPSASPPPLTTPAEQAPAAQEKSGRRERRRQRRLAGIPRRITFRVLLFAVLLVAVVAAAYGFVRWYATDDWYVTLHRDRVVIYQGRPGGLLWFQPKVVDRTGVTATDVLPFRLPALLTDVQEPSLAAARHYVANLKQEFEAQHLIANGLSTTPTTSTSTTTTQPVTSLTTSVPGAPATPTTVPPDGGF